MVPLIRYDLWEYLFIVGYFYHYKYHFVDLLTSALVPSFLFK